MMRRTPNRWSQLKVGLVLLIALGGLLIAVMNLDEGVGIFTPRAMLRAHLDDSQGLKVGAPVRMNGVDVGNVKRIAIEGGQGKVAVHFTVNRDVRPLLHGDASVLIRSMGLLGDKYLEILPGSPQQPLLPEQAILTGRSEADLTDAAGNASATLLTVNQTLKDLQGILTSLKEGRGTAGKLVNDPALYDQTRTLLQKVEKVSEQTTVLLAKVERGEGSLGKLLTDRGFYDRAYAAADELQKLSTELNRSDGSLGRLARDPALYQRLEGLTSKGETLVGKIERGDGTLGKLVTQDALYQRADKILNDMEALLADVKKNPTKYFKFSVF